MAPFSCISVSLGKRVREIARHILHSAENLCGVVGKTGATSPSGKILTEFDLVIILSSLSHRIIMGNIGEKRTMYIILSSRKEDGLCI